MSSNRKGRGYEIDLCRQFSLWWTDGQDDDLFWHTAGSGGMATTRTKKGKKTAHHYGDVFPVDERGRKFCELFTVEIKRGYNKHSIQDLFDWPMKSKTRMKPAAIQQYEKWIFKIDLERAAAESYAWLLIVRRDQRDAIVIMPSFVCKNISAPVEPCWSYLSVPIRESQKWTAIHFLAICRLSEFLEWCDPEQLKNWNREGHRWKNREPKKMTQSL